MTNEYKILIERLDFFIKKYYRNQLLRGIIFSSILFLFLYFFVSFTEYFGHFSSAVRATMFYSAIALLVVIFAKYILSPILKLNKIGETINHVQAAQIISKHFADVKDKLLNVLELASLENKFSFSGELINASIEQKITEIKPIPFALAINTKEVNKYFKFLIFTILFLSIVFAINPPIFTQGTKRVLNYNTFYAKELPFKYIVLNDSLSVRKGADFKLQVKLDGNIIPNNISINYSGNSFLMQKESKTEFSYTLKNINNNISFTLKTEDTESQVYEIVVLPPPIIIDFKIFAEIPEYTGEENKVFNSVGDISVPCGTKLKWVFNTSDIQDISMKVYDSLVFKSIKKDEKFELEKRLLNSTKYEIIASNKYFKNETVLKYAINIIPDQYANIKVLSLADSINKKVMYYKGIINDDYGFDNLYFVYTNPIDKKTQKSNIQINKNINSQEFYFSFDFSNIEVDEKNSAIEYYFEVWDNDRVNGSKASKSEIFEMKIPSIDELRKEDELASSNLQSKISQSEKLASEIQKDFNKLKQQLVDKNLSDFEKNKKLQDLAQKQENLQKLVQEISKENAVKNQMNNSLNENEKELLEKQNQIQDLLENLMNDEMKKLMEEFEKLMSEFDKEKFNKLNEDAQMSYEDLKKQLDRNLEMLKKMEIDQKIKDKIDDLKSLAEKQNKLSNETQDKNKTSQEIKDKQNDIKNELDKIQKDYDQIKKENKELENPEKLDEFQKEFNDINQEINQAQENTESKRSKASQNQKNSSSKMQDLAQKMQQMMDKNEKAEHYENAEDLRQIIDNLSTFSFDQEAIMTTLQNINFKDPKYNILASKQSNLNENFNIINDSLNALAKRTPEISSEITEEVLSIRKNLAKITKDLQDNYQSSAVKQQQYVMTSANNLALLLSEVLKQMQNSMKQQQQSGGQCNKPKPGKFPGMKMSQQSLKSQLEQMIEQMKSGKGKLDKNSMNKQIAQMIAEQEKFTKMMNDLKSKSSLSPETTKKLNEINQLNEQNQKDLINKNISPQLLKRQELILTRLLEAENSEQEREIDKKRESKEVIVEKYSNPNEKIQYNSLNLKFNDLLFTNIIELNKYYKEKYKIYIQNLNNEK